MSLRLFTNLSNAIDAPCLCSDQTCSDNDDHVIILSMMDKLTENVHLKLHINLIRFFVITFCDITRTSE